MAYLYKLPPFTDRSAETARNKMRKAIPRDLCDGTLRLVLHLSAFEHGALEFLNPDTLGAEDAKIRSAAWANFINSRQSYPFKVNRA